VHAACETAIHIEYFHDHVRAGAEVFAGVPEPVDGCLDAESERPSLGLRLRR
jgi:hypothetical protein